MATTNTFTKNGKYSGRYFVQLEFGASDQSKAVDYDLTSVADASDFIKEAKKGPVAITIDRIDCASSGTPAAAGITTLTAIYDSSTNTLTISMSISEAPGSEAGRTYTISGNILALHSLVK
jgi:hypothetical protein